ncbi:MAG: diaminopimelate epimerase [Chloroflexota bacterium]|nr:diaminopimelate epimerase [Chloroflexota bacterium]
MLTKSHGLGNDYLVADPAELPFTVTPERVRLICDRHVGVGSDGMLVLEGDTGVRIYNPDGSEAEKSGNGLRIFAKWLYDSGRAHRQHFTIHTRGGSAEVEIVDAGGRATEVSVAMGQPVFREDLRALEVGGETLSVVGVSLGNPHCVVQRQMLDVTELRRLGPLVERHAAFPNRTNVQLARAPARDHVELLIWERGAGETQASGSSACAVVAAYYRLGLVDTDVTATMPGGELHVRIDTRGSLLLRGPVEEVATITLSPELIARLRALP